MTACTQSRYCCVLSELLGAPVLFNMYSVENSFAAISLSQNIAVCPLLPQNKDTLSHPEDTAICSRSVTPSSPRGVEVGLSHHSVPLCWLGGRWDSAIIRSRLENLWDSAIVQSRLENLPVLTRLGPVLAGGYSGVGVLYGVLPRRTIRDFGYSPTHSCGDRHTRRVMAVVVRCRSW